MRSAAARRSRLKVSFTLPELLLLILDLNQGEHLEVGHLLPDLDHDGVGHPALPAWQDAELGSRVLRSHAGREDQLSAKPTTLRTCWRSSLSTTPHTESFSACDKSWPGLNRPRL